MKKVKYFWLARYFKAALQLAFGLCIIVSSATIIGDCLFSQSYIEVGNWTFGEKKPGHRIKAQLQLNIPDSVLYFKNGMSQRGIGDKPNRYFKNDKPTNWVSNRFHYYNATDISISNRIYPGDEVYVLIDSKKNKVYNLFFAFQQQFEMLFSAFCLLLLIKITNRYLDGIIFQIRTFKLISIIGIAFIAVEFIRFLFGIVNENIVGYTRLETTTQLGDLKTGIEVLINWGRGVSFTNIAIGIIVILFSEVIKEGIRVKQENDLTI